MIQFKLSNKEEALFREWEKNLPEALTGAIGGRIVFTFCPTSIGVVVRATDIITDLEIDLTDYSMW